MCPFFLLTFLFSILFLLAQVTSALISVTFHPAAVKELKEGKTQSVNFTLTWNGDRASSSEQTLLGSYRFHADRPDVADVPEPEKYFTVTPGSLTANGTTFDGSFQVRANFLGYSRIEIQKKSSASEENAFTSLLSTETLAKSAQLVVSVSRDKDLMQKIFIYSVAIVVSLSYINMGCALDMQEVVQVLRRPVAPAIGFFSQYFCMPLISFGLAALLFDETYLKLGLFIFGCSPGGGASNMWAVLLGGNLNLSITMTFLSTLLSFGLMPFWLYTLGRTIFEGTSAKPPVRSILTTLGSMFIFLCIGLLIRRKIPRLANVCRRILAPFSVLMIIFIIIFGTYTNLYMFKVMDWRMLVATAANVWSGMAIGFLIALLFGKPMEDLIAIAIETGVQNTGVSIVVLGLSLPQPDADLASAVPVAASLMTPIPLTVVYICLKLRHYLQRGRHMTILNSDSSFEKDGQFKGANGSNGSQSCNASNVTVLEAQADEHFDLDLPAKRSNTNLIGDKA